MTCLITLQERTGKGSRKFISRSVGKEKTNSLCRERNRKVCSNLWSYNGYQKILNKVPKLSRKYRASMGKKSPKIYTGAEEEEGRKQCAINNWKSYRSTIAHRGSARSQVTFNKSTNSWCYLRNSGRFQHR